jgi:hypothetical protein
MQIPLIYDVDVLVYGAVSGTVAAALSAREAGKSVLAVSDRPYFGEETAGALQLWPKVRSEDPLFRKVFPSDSPPTPLHIKSILERELLEADIPFLYTCRPVFALRDLLGNLAGFVLAARSSLYGVLCRVAIDASHCGLLTHLAGVSLVEGSLSKERHLVVVGAAPPTGSSFTWQETSTPLTILEGEKKLQTSGFTITLRTEEWGETIADQAVRDFLAYTRIYYPGLELVSDTWVENGGPKLAGAGRLYDNTTSLPDSLFPTLDRRLWVMNRLLPLTLQGETSLWELADQLHLGRKVGRFAAQASRDLPKLKGPYTATTGENTDETLRGEIRFAPSFIRPRQKALMIDIQLDSIPTVHSCDVAVAGGGTAGAPAGISAARAGASTVVLERLHALGGVGTLGLIASYWFGNRVGFTQEIDQGVDAFSTDPKSVQSGDWNNMEKAGWFARELYSNDGKAWFNSFVFGVAIEKGRVVGVLASTPFGAGVVQSGVVIDATGNADVAAAAGAPCREVKAEHVAVQGTGLSPLRPGHHYRNTDHTFIDENDLVGVTHSFVNARTKFPREFDISPLIGTRERRQICGEIELSPLDFLARRTFPDTMVTASSNFDSHGFTVHPIFMVIPPDHEPLRAHVPFRCMLPKGVERVLVTGLGMSAHRDALPVIRMQPDVQNQGYAAGLAAAQAAKANTDFRSLNIRALQKELVGLRILDPEILEHEDSFPLPEDMVREAVAQGPVNLLTVAIMFSHPEVSTPYLIEQLKSTDNRRREDAARILGLMGRPEAAKTLAAIVAGREWDEGWNYRGMGQFGASISPLDSLVIALGKTESELAVDPILEKIESLDENSAFSHCRAVSIATSALGDSKLAKKLFQLLQKPGMLGHAQLNTSEVVANANSNPEETEARNRSLKELVLGRGLYLCGDFNGLGREILETYTNDLRGHYARHAQAVLSYPNLEDLHKKVL